MHKRLFFLFFVFALSMPYHSAESVELRDTPKNPGNPETLASNRLYQHWIEWQSGFNLAALETSSNWTKPGNAANFAWTQISRVRSFGEIFAVTGDEDWLARMADELDVVFSYKGHINNDGVAVDYLLCYGLTLKGWMAVDSTNPDSYSAVHQGLILTAFLEYVEHVRSMNNPPAALINRANDYEAYAIEVIDSLNLLYDTEQDAGETVGYYKVTEVQKTPCEQPPKFRIGPHNQTLALGTVLDLLTRLGHVGYEATIVEMARGLKHDLTIPVGANHYEWPYWPTYSEAYKERASNEKAEDHSHGALDIEFVVAVHQSGYLDGGSTLFSTTDIGRFVATMTDKLDRGDDNFAFRVNGLLTLDSDNQGKINSMKRGWALLGQYHRPILDIGDRRCTNNNSHVNATLLKLGGLELSCPGWCPSSVPGTSSSQGTAILATFNSQTATNGWQKSSTAICTDYGDTHHIDYPDTDPLHGSSGEDPDARLNAKGGRGYLEIFEQDNSDQTCNPQQLGSKDLAFYRDLNLDGDEVLIELAGFSRSKSTATSVTSTVTNRSAFFLERDATYSALSSTQNSNFVGSQDSFWQPFNVFVEPAGKTEVRAVVGMRDSWGSDHNQSLGLDDVMICSADYCGNDSCGSDETVETCPGDCITNLGTFETKYDFQGSAEGWLSANISGYSYSNVNGALVAEEDAPGGTHSGEDLDETAGLELAWYQDFDRQNDIPVVLKGLIKVSSANANVGPINNLCVAIVNPSLSGYPVVVKRCQKWVNTTSSGWHDFEYDFTKKLENNQTYRVVIGTFDSWGADKGQKLEIASVDMIGLTELAPPIVVCGNNICDAGETSASCPADCPLQPRVSSFDFSSGSQGWLNTSTSLYSYNVENGELIGEEISSGTEPNPPEVADLDINWYQDFDYNQGEFSVSGKVRVKSSNVTNAKTTRYCVALVAVDTNPTTYIEILGSKKCKDWPQSTDSGWQDFDEDYSSLVIGESKVRVVIGMPDSWSINWNQEIKIDSVEVTHGLE